MDEKKVVSAVIVAAGNSTRFSKPYSKIFERLLEKPAIFYTLRAFEKSKLIDEIIVVCKEKDITEIEKILHNEKISKKVLFAAGGETRQESVTAGVNATGATTTHVAIHDAARILVSSSVIDSAVRDALKTGASVVGVPAKDTMKCVDENEQVLSTPDRTKVWCAQTPQIFEKNLYLQALNFAKKQGKDFTDDSQIIENYGEKVHMVMGDYTNMKLTTPDDKAIFESVLRTRKEDLI